MARILHQVNLDALQNVEPARRRELWERLPGEPARAFRAFAMFRDALERRVVSEVGAKLTPPCSRQNVWRWSFRWRWEERAAAFDVEQDRVQRAATVTPKRAHLLENWCPLSHLTLLDRQCFHSLIFIPLGASRFRC